MSLPITVSSKETPDGSEDDPSLGSLGVEFVEDDTSILEISCTLMLSMLSSSLEDLVLTFSVLEALFTQ
jgi:hypothetical protein